MSIQVNNQFRFFLRIMVQEALLKEKEQILIILYFHG